MSILTDTFGNDKGKIGQAHLAALVVEIEVLKSKIQPHDTGHIHTAISVLNERIAEIESCLNEYYNQSPDSSVGRASV